MNKEHVSERLLSGYASGADGLAGDEVWALEAHLESCAHCRGRLAVISMSSVASLADGVWAELGPKLDSVRPQPLRSSLAAGLRSWVTPVMVPWLLMIGLLPLLGLWLDRVAFANSEGYSFVLLFAPVLPVIGVAASWSRGLDPAYELITSAPRGGFYLVLRRTTAVLVLVLPVQLVAGGLSGSGFALGLLPSLAFTTGTLALGGVIGVTRAAYVLVALWVAVIVLPTVASQRQALALEPRLIPVWGGIFVLTAAVVALRRSAFGLLKGYDR